MVNKKISGLLLVILVALMFLVSCSSGTEEGVEGYGGEAGGIGDTESSASVVEYDIYISQDGISPDYIEATYGDTVILNVYNDDGYGTVGFGMRSFGIDENPIYSGSPEVYEFVADGTGSYEFYCDTYCDIAIYGEIYVWSS
jgi:plastocyanin